MVFLIGVDHLIQYNGPVPESIRVEFRSYLVRICRELDIKTIAEEFSDEALREVYQATAETAQEAARMLGIEHRYCDPGWKEFAELDIPSFGDLLEEARKKFNASPSYILDNVFRKKVADYAAKRARSYWHIRERYWLDQLRDILNLNILFICGHEHVKRFSSLLVENGYKCAIIDRFWMKELFADYSNLGLS